MDWTRKDRKAVGVVGVLRQKTICQNGLRILELPIRPLSRALDLTNLLIGTEDVVDLLQQTPGGFVASIVRAKHIFGGGPS
jgi:hypothetical protein